MHLFVNYELHWLYLLTDGGLEVGLLLEEVEEAVGLRRLEVGWGLGLCACLENSADFLVEKSKNNQFFQSMKF